jgi:hypothetical protein
LTEDKRTPGGRPDQAPTEIKSFSRYKDTVGAKFSRYGGGEVQRDLDCDPDNKNNAKEKEKKN